MVGELVDGGYFRKYDKCPDCNSANIVYTRIVCANDSIQYRFNCCDCGLSKPVPHEENFDRNKIEENRRSKWAYQVKNADGFACRLCGSTDRIEAHHIVPWTADVGQRYNPSNGITLCWHHHNLIHTWRRNHGEE
jgi:hypothetical protein